MPGTGPKAGPPHWPRQEPSRGLGGGGEGGFQQLTSPDWGSTVPLHSMRKEGQQFPLCDPEPLHWGAKTCHSPRRLDHMLAWSAWGSG